MLLSELEPGQVFKLTEAAVKAERERLAAEGYPSMKVNGVGRELYQVMLPQRTSKGLFFAPELFSASALVSRFVPSVKTEYEVELVTAAEAGETFRNLPSRAWLMTSADPEMFLERGGKIVPGFSVLPEKKKPGTAPTGGVYHEDGFQAEVSPSPAECHETVLNSMNYAVASMMEHVEAKLHYTEKERFKLSDATFVELTPEQLATGTDAQVALGCDRSENVWGHTPFTPGKAREFPYRMAGGHIHLGTAANAQWFHSRAERIIKAMDVFLGVPSVALFAGIEDPRRRNFYGRAGEFRFQKHGLEYRVLSNAWLQHGALAHLTFNLARGAFRLGTTDWESSFKYDPEYVRYIINEHDVDAAKKFVEENAAILIWLLDKDGGYGWGAQGLTTIYQGAKKTFGERLGIHSNWASHKYQVTAFHEYTREYPVKPWGTPKGEKKVVSRRRVTIPGLGVRESIRRTQQAEFDRSIRELEVALNPLPPPPLPPPPAWYAQIAGQAATSVSGIQGAQTFWGQGLAGIVSVDEG